MPLYLYSYIPSEKVVPFIYHILCSIRLTPPPPKKRGENVCASYGVNTDILIPLLLLPALGCQGCPREGECHCILPFLTLHPTVSQLFVSSLPHCNPTSLCCPNYGCSTSRPLPSAHLECGMTPASFTPPPSQLKCPILISHYTFCLPHCPLGLILSAMGTPED